MSTPTLYRPVRVLRRLWPWPAGELCQVCMRPIQFCRAFGCDPR